MRHQIPTPAHPIRQDAVHQPSPVIHTLRITADITAPHLSGMASLDNCPRFWQPLKVAKTANWRNAWRTGNGRLDEVLPISVTAAETVISVALLLSARSGPTAGMRTAAAILTRCDSTSVRGGCRADDRACPAP